jgi:hypothetical protein
MGDAYYRDFIKSGKKLILDTKTPRLPTKKTDKTPSATDAMMGGGKPMTGFETFIKRIIKSKTTKKEICEDFENFIKQAEEAE